MKKRYCLYGLTINRGRRLTPGAPNAYAPYRGFDVRQHVVMSWYFRAVSVVASSIPITSYSSPR